jgi:hypothetical protein
MSGDEAAQTFPKTHAKELYCLTDKDLEPLPVEEKRNPYRKGTPMKLYRQPDVSYLGQLIVDHPPIHLWRLALGKSGRTPSYFLV